MKPTLSVSQLLTIIKDVINADSRLKFVLVTGELSNFTLHKFGHAYFSLKDDQGKINCVMFKNNAQGLRFLPKDGMAVLVSGYIALYESGGQIQINVTSMQEAGIGDLYKQLEILREKLQKEGLFASEHKKKLPAYPEKIAIIAAKDSAAAADIKINLARRWPIAQSDFYLANMQGRYAVPEIIEQLQIIDQQNYDLIILARGGGSFEDLYCFNEESLVRAIFALTTPLVSGIGHESDTTLTDLVADLRAPTPTAAVELVTPDINTEKQHLQHYRKQLQAALCQSAQENRLLLEVLIQRLNQSKQAIQRRFDEFRLIETAFFRRMESFSGEYALLLNSYRHELNAALNQRISTERAVLRETDKLLTAYNPLKILDRGYAIITKEDKPLLSSQMVDKGDLLKIQLKDGRLLAEVKDKE